jgi:hypothetical protein
MRNKVCNRLLMDGVVFDIIEGQWLSMFQLCVHLVLSVFCRVFLGYRGNERSLPIQSQKDVSRLL